MDRVFRTTEGGEEERALRRLMESALILLYSLVPSGQIDMRRLDVYEKIGDVIAREEDAAA